MTIVLTTIGQMMNGQITISEMTNAQMTIGQMTISQMFSLEDEGVVID